MRPYWDRDEMRPAVRMVFGKALQCHTAELGAEVYSSENQELILYHPCKSRACPSCGYRANVQWLRERWAALPAAPYKGITFTMPNQLRAVFRDNRPLAKALSALAAEVIQARVSAKYAVRVGVIAILHTFNGKLEFNSHANVQWLRERWAALPDAPYKGITFTMPNELRAVFRDNRPLAKALSALAAEVIQARVSVKYAVRVGVIAILHTFNGKLEFNSHVHTMVTGGGLHESSGIWVSRVGYDCDLLMKSWRKAVIALRLAALRAGQLRTELTADQMEDLLTHLEKCWWSIKIQSFEDKWHFLQYAGRYVRRPPIAQRRITWIGERTVRFWYKDKKLRRRAYVQCSLEEFIDRWAQHILEPCQHAVRSFGLFAPRALGQNRGSHLCHLRQERRARPKPRPWAESIERDFGHDPLVDRTGKRMKWVRRLAPNASC